MKYGIHVLHCDCGWKTMARHYAPTKCEACDKPGEAEFTEEVAGMVCTYSDLKEGRIREYAYKSGLILYQMSKYRWVVLRVNASFRVPYKDGQVRAYMGAEAVGQPGNWVTVMKIIRDNSPDLPEYLKEKK